MQNGFNFELLLESLSESLADKVAVKLEGRFGHANRVSRLLTVEQAATYLGRTKEAVQHMVSSGKLPTVRSDRRVFVDVVDLDRWIEDNKQKGLV
jgi:excisionase family DNA binding protein